MARKAQLQAEIARLKDLNATLTRDRDGVLANVHEAVRGLRADVAGLKDKAEAHGHALKKQGDALAKHGDDLAGLSEAVQASLLGRAEDKPAQPEPAPVTPIKRGTKATG